VRLLSAAREQTAGVMSRTSSDSTKPALRERRRREVDTLRRVEEEEGEAALRCSRADSGRHEQDLERIHDTGSEGTAAKRSGHPAASGGGGRCGCSPLFASKQRTS